MVAKVTISYSISASGSMSLFAQLNPPLPTMLHTNHVCRSINNSLTCSNIISLDQNQRKIHGWTVCMHLHRCALNLSHALNKEINDKWWSTHWNSDYTKGSHRLDRAQYFSLWRTRQLVKISNCTACTLLRVMTSDAIKYRKSSQF